MADHDASLSGAERRAALIHATLERRRSGGGAGAGQGGAGPRPPDVIPRRGDSGPAPLSFAQERLWFLEQLEQTAGGYHIGVALRLEGDLCAAALACALDEVVRRHESLRTRFEAREGQPVQVVEPPRGMPLLHVDLTGLAPERRATALPRLARAAIRRPFDLSRGPLVRAVLLRLEPGCDALVVAVHHIVSDGWSSALLMTELTAHYRALLTGERAALPELTLHYADYAVWQRRWLTGEALERQLAWWRKLLAGAPEELALPADRPRQPVQTFRGASQSVRWQGALRSSLAALARREGGTPFMVLLAGWAALLGRYSGQPDLTVGTPIAGRNRLDLEPLIGLFANTLVLRADLRGRPTFAEAVRRLKEVALGAYAHQEVPFEKLVADLRPKRSLSHTPLFQVLFALQNVGGELPGLPGVRIERLGVDLGAARFDLELLLSEAGGGLAGRLVYNRDLFDAATARRMVRHLGALLESAAASPDRPLAEIPLLSAPQRHQLSREWGLTGAPPLAAATLPAAFEAQADRTPEAPAAAGGGLAYSFRELDRRANRIAHRLLRLGVGPEARVAVLLERSGELPAVLLGVHKAGGAYVPLDPAHPADRLGMILASSRPAVLVTDRGSAGAAPSWGGPTLTLDAEGEEELAASSPERPGLAIDPRSLAYAIFTSGSTGRPKGVEIAHGALVNFLAAMVREPGLGPGDTLVAVTTLTFDIAGLELFLPLVAGARVVVADRETAADAARLTALLAEHGATALQATPATWRMLLESGWAGDPGLAALCGGETMPPDLAAALRPRVASLWNLYGPTETTVWSTLWRVEEGGGSGPVPVGRPIADTTVGVVGAAAIETLPPGVVGELWIGGAGVARGYLGQPGLTAERFVPAPAAGGAGGRPGGRAYRTGDLARFRADGTLELLGRIDHQVKLRGFRIELGEIEAVLAGHPGVAQAVVLAREDRPGDHRLVAYVVPCPPGAADAELRRHLREKLPEYMVPAAFVELERFPLTPSGKVDRGALPAPEWGPGEVRVAPRDGIEEELARIWSELLRVPAERLGATDDFFELGGHSLLATRMISRLVRTFGVQLDLRSLLEHPTIAGVRESLEAAAGRELAERTGQAGTPAAPAPTGRRTAPLSFAQERLWFLDRMGTARGGYNITMLLALRGDLRVTALARAVDEVVRRHESLRTRFEPTEGGPVQVIEAETRVRLGTVDLSRLGARREGEGGGRTEAAARRLVAAVGRHPFDLARGPLLCPVLIRFGERDHLLVLAVHHIVSDGWSLGVLYRELAGIYRAFAAGEPSPLPEISFHYADFAAWQREWLSGRELERQLGFWRRQLAGLPEELRLPVDRPHPPVQSYRGDAVGFALDRAVWRSLEALSRSERGTLFMVLAAAFSTLLSRYGGQRDLAVGTPIANRTRSEIEPLIGFFVNTLVLRCDLAGDPPFREMVRRLREVAIEAYAHQDLPFEKLVAELRPRRNLSHTPLFQVMVVLQNVPTEAAGFPGLEVRPLAPESVAARFDLELVFGFQDGQLAGRLIFNRDLFDRTTARRMTGHLLTLLAGAAAAPEAPLSRLGLLSAGERHQLLREADDTRDPGDAGLGLERSVAPLHRWIEARVERTPDLPALACEGEWLTYAELNARANRLARRLRRLGVGPEGLVAVAAERSVELVVALVAVLKAGGAYLPLDPSYPDDRLAYMLADAGARWLLLQGRLLGELPPIPGGVEVLDLDARPEPWAGELPGDLPGGAGPDHLAYTIYTSGSTGRPKGVMNTHRGIVNRLVWMQRAFGLGPEERVLQKTPASFDVSVWEFFWPLMTGACLVVARPEGHKDSAYLARVVARERITTLHFVPSMLQLFLGERSLAGCAGLRRVIASGEALPRELVERCFERLGEPAELHNLYGPTEAAVDVTWWPCERGARRRAIPIGRPIANTSIQVVDEQLQPLPLGVPGEVVIGGVNLARGYLGRPGLTAERFVPDSSAGPGSPGSRRYRTGDLARRLGGGEVEFLGRLDHQVKVRGFRIELGEIEARLLEHPAVREAVVVARPDDRGELGLVAYAAAAEGERLEPAALREHLRRTLPEHMVPPALVALDALPLSPSGKVDRRALPAPAGPRAAPAAGAAPPRTGIERTVAAVWREVLGRDAVGAEENFFDLGGHSLLLIEVQRLLERELGRPLEVVELFRHPTVASLARFLERGPGGEAARQAAAPAATAAPAGATQIAVVGMAGRFPGADGVEAFWRLLEEGREGVRALSDEDLRRAGLTEADWSVPGYVRVRGVLEGAESFDAAFFDYSPREAQIMDPQQRAFLEAAWEALEHAGYDSRRTGGRVGVFAGAGMNSYLFNLMAHPELVDAVGAYQAAIGNKNDSLPTRVSYKLDLKGPSVNVQTACSSSLVAVHLACRSLLDGECEMALAGGVAITGAPTGGYRFLPGGIASPDGRCRAFDAEARGTVAGEGVGVVVLKRLADAMADGDTVHAVIRGSAINNDGSLKAGFTAPGVDGQAEVIARAQAAAGVAPSSIRYVEAHGTGTELGDPIEIAALAQAFHSRNGSEPPAPGRCAIGSVKTNIGHLDAAAGVVGLIKTVLALERRRIPPSLHFRRPNPKIDFAAGPFFVNAEPADWPAGDGPLRAGVSSFGIGGTNAHAVVEEAPPLPPSGPSRPWQLLVLSARTEPALEEASRRLAGHLRAHPEQPLADVAYTLQAGRRPWGLRRAVVCRDAEEGAAWLEGREPRRLLAGRAAGAEGGAPGVVFLFPGQGAQYPGMGAELYRVERVFRETLDRCAEGLAPELGLDLRRVLFAAAEDEGEAAAGARDAARRGREAERLRDTALAQPALFAVAYALARLWRSWGIEPEAMLGHSVGELVAACLAGVFSLEDALGVVAARGRLMQAMPPGAMLAASLGEQEVAPLVEELGGGLALAAVNGPEAVVVSGPAGSVEALRERLAARGATTRSLHTSHAFHSAMMDPVLEPFAERLRRVELRAPQIPFVSNLTGAWITPEQATDPGYWVRQMRDTVRFAEGLSTLFETPGRALLEVGPGRTLATLARQHPGRSAAREVAYSLPHPQAPDSDGPFLLATLGRLWVAGVAVDWEGFRGDELRRRVPLPAYPFQRRRFWVDRIGRAGRVGRLGLPAPCAAAASADELGPAADPGAPADGDPPRATPYAPPRSDLERLVAAAWQELLGTERVGIHDEFFELGGSSLLAVRLSARLRERLGVELDPHALLERPTVAALAEALAAAGAAGTGEQVEAPSAPERASLLVEVRAGNPFLLPLFLVHPAGGHVYRFRELGRGLAEAGFPGSVLALRAPGLGEGEEPLGSVEQMAERYLEEVRRAQPGGPYHLAGSSMGGMIAYEMARRLHEEGERVGLVALLDTFGPGQMPAVFARPEEAAAEAAARVEAGDEPEGEGEAAPEARRARRVAAAATRAMLAYRAPAYPGRVVFFRAALRRPGDPDHPELAWIGPPAGGTEVHVVPGDHDTMHEPPHAAVLAALLAGYLPRDPAATGPAVSEAEQTAWAAAAADRPPELASQV